MTFGECRRVWRVWRVHHSILANLKLGRFMYKKKIFLGIKRSSLSSPNSPDSPNSPERVTKICSILAKFAGASHKNLANFWQVLEFAKFAGEWPLLSYCPNSSNEKQKFNLLPYSYKKMSKSLKNGFFAIIGKWDTFLITPDKKCLRCQSELKLYIAKAGAVIDSNIVNFALPKKTAKVDKTLGKLLAKTEKQKEKEGEKEEAKGTEEGKESQDKEEQKTEEETEEIDEEDKEKEEEKEKKVKREMKKLGVPENRNSGSLNRRETKVPLKYRIDDELTSSAKKAKIIKIVKSPKKKPEEPEHGEKKEVVTSEPIVDVVERAAEKVDLFPSVVAVKSVPPPPSSPLAPSFESYSSSTSTSMSSAVTSRQLSAIGVGTFSIDEETAKRK
jgi:hypothetical protein